MQSFVYQGISKEYREQRIAAMLSQLTYPEKAAKALYYYEDKKDSPAMAEEKKKRRAKYQKERTVELNEKLDNMDVAFSLGGIEFPKGKPIAVDPKTGLVDKLMVLAKAGKLKVVDGQDKGK